MQEIEGFDFAKYREVLQAYKDINNLISSTRPSEKDIDDQKKLSQTLKDLQISPNHNKDEHLGTENRLEHKETNEMRNRNSVLKEIEEKENGLRIKENELALKETKLKDQEQILLKLAGQLKTKEKQLQDKEIILTKEIMELENIKQANSLKNQELNVETFEPISLTACDKEAKQREENLKMLQEEVEELKEKIGELEDSNVLLNTKNTFLEEEFAKAQSELNEQKFKIAKEAEKLINKENLLKVREQTLENRENKLIESTKFINSAIKSVNLCMKAKIEKGENQEKEQQNLKSIPEYGLKPDDLTFRGFVRNLGEIKDFSNILNQGNLTAR